MKRSNEEKFSNYIRSYIEALYKREIGNAIRKGKLKAKRRRYESTN